MSARQPSRVPTFSDACEALLRDPDGDHSLYTTLAPLYDRMTADDDRYAAQLRTVEARVPASARTILEVGCGVGRLLPDLAERHGAAAGLDASPELLSIAGDRVAAAEGIDLLGADVADPGFDLGRKFDAAVSLEFLTAHLAGDAFDRALWNVRDHLHDGGTFVCDAVADARAVEEPTTLYSDDRLRYVLERSVTVDPVDDGTGDLVVSADYRVTDRVADETATVRERTPIRTFDPAELVEAVEAAGFRAVEVDVAAAAEGTLVVSARA